MDRQEKEKLLDKYCGIVMRYDPVFGLTGAKSVEDFRKNHVDDALIASDAIRRLLPKGVDEIADIGSGCGVPGVALAIEFDLMGFILVERSSRRADFLRLCVAALGLSGRVSVMTSDIGNLKSAFKFAVSRALGNFAQMEKDLYACLENGGTLVMYKGRVDEARKTETLHFEERRIIRLKCEDKERCLLVLRK